MTLNLEGKDNRGKPRQEFADKIGAADDHLLVTLAEEFIWLSAYASNNPRSDYHWMADACYDEFVARGKPELYSLAHKKAAGTL